MLRVRVRSPQDLGAAMVFMVIGIAGLAFGGELAFGSSAKMGPGYFPKILSVLILAIGAMLAVKAVTVDGPGIERVQLRPICFIIAAIVLFGALLPELGLVVTAILVTLLAAFARRVVNLRETLWLGAGLALFSVAVFVLALSQPLPIGWWAG